ncbi:MAG: T9SS type A sorting domain-containing protein, partial [Candidatus Cloacimonetes bacterium]|nr:T9SS type A sorting domain-containing protein [Candidatus Cloacimonadota bacterium]
KWAVLFDFTAYFPGDSCQFQVEDVVIYNPLEDLSNSFTVELRDYDDSGQPGTFISESTASSTTYGWQTINFGNVGTFEKIWVVFLYETALNSRYIATSSPDNNYPRCDGTHSFWWEQDPDNPLAGYYYSMASTSFPAEFLVGLTGLFILPAGHTDLSMTDFVMAGETWPGGELYPRVTIRNNNWDDYPNTEIVIEINSPGTNPAGDTTLLLDVGHIDGFSEVTYSSPMPWTLPEPISQYEVTATIISPDSIESNNSRDYDFDTFTTPRSHILIENMLRTDMSSLDTIWQEQTSEEMPDDVLIINCFPDISDSTWYFPGSLYRFNYYALSGLPGTVVDGEYIIPGFIAGAYQDSLSSAILSTDNRGGFLEISYLQIAKADDDFVDVYFTLENDFTHVFPNYVSSCKLHAAIVENGLTLAGDSIPGYTMLSMVSGADGLPLQGLTFGVPVMDGDFYYDTLIINPIHAGDYDANLNNLHLAMWIQNEDTHEIPWIEIYSLEDNQVGNTADDIPPVTQMSIYPNPFRQNLTIELPASETRNADDIICNIYNIRGQLVKRLEQSATEAIPRIIWNGANEKGKPVSDGVYFVRVKAGATNWQTTKCMLIK